MMTTALIFAGGVGERMNSRAKPKQFLEIHGKPILIYTIDYFEGHPEVDNIVVVCLESWMRELKKELRRNFIHKVKWIVGGGETGHDSIYNGLCAIKDSCGDDTIILLHDGVRPLITDDLISDNISTCRQYGSAVTVSRVTESIAEIKDHKIERIPDRNILYEVKAPQTFYFKDIWQAHQEALKDGYKSIDSASLMRRYGYRLCTVPSSSYNIKITSPSDYYIFRAIYDARENLQIFGL